MIRHKKNSPAEGNDQYEELSLAEALMKFIEKLFSLFRPSCTFEEFLENTNEYFEERIRHREAKGDVKYAGGEIIFTLSGNKVEMNSKLYFVDKAEKWIVQESSNAVDKSRFSDWDTDKYLQSLLQGEKVEFDINLPENN